MWPPVLYTDDFLDQCDLPEEINYTTKPFLEKPTVHIHTYNDEYDPSYLITELWLWIDKSKYNIKPHAQGGLACVAERKKVIEGVEDIDEEYNGFGMMFLNRFTSIPTEDNPFVTSNYYEYNVEYFNYAGGNEDDIVSFSGETDFKP